MTYKILLAAGLVAASSATATAQNVFQTKVDSKFGDASLVWGGAIGKGYDARVKFVLDGKGHLALCGIGRVVNIHVSESVTDALRGGYVSIKGKKRLKNFRYFAKAKSKSEMKSGVANCKSTGVKPPKRSSDLKFSYGKATFRN